MRNSNGSVAGISLAPRNSPGKQQKLSIKPAYVWNMLKDSPVRQIRKLTWSTPFRAGLTASILLHVFYVLVILLSSSSYEHLLDLIREDGAFVGAITVGFGVQIALFRYLRHGMHHVSRSATVVGASGSGTSTIAMVACCLHHVADIAPIAGLTGAALFLSEYKRDLMGFGLAMMLLGILWMLGLILYHRRHGRLAPLEELKASSAIKEGPGSVSD